jgi:hypothetical protein
MIFLYYSTVFVEISKNISCGFHFYLPFLLKVASQVLQGEEFWVNGRDRLN